MTDLDTPIYLTTPLYYVNDELHIGHATTTIYADTLARFWRAVGRPVLFLTGSDEHGQKIAKAAAAAGTDPRSFADGIVAKFYELWEQLDITYDIFIRTTDEFHETAVKKLFTQIYDGGHIYKANYNALYCVECETNYTEKDLVEAKCPIHHTEPQHLNEENYFFKLSAFNQSLLDHLNQHPQAIVPEGRRAEILGKLKEGAQDNSISRTAFDWGVPLPWDKDHVLWVWSDALVNYISGLGWPEADALPTSAIAGRSRHQPPPVPDGLTPFQYWWPHCVHLVGKDILWHHSTVWWSLLLAADLAPPQQVFAHGWWQVEGEKMSKTLGNVIRPGAIAEEFGRDALRFHVLRAGPAKSDSDWRRAAFIERYNAELANGLGNLCNRTLKMLAKYFDGVVPPETAFTKPALEAARAELIALVDGLGPRLLERVEAFDLNGALSAIWELIRRANRFVDETQPFKLAKDESRAQDLRASIYALCEVVRVLAAAIVPFLPDSAVRLAKQLNLSDTRPLLKSLKWGGFNTSGHRTGEPEGLFQRIETPEAR